MWCCLPRRIEPGQFVLRRRLPRRPQLRTLSREISVAPDQMGYQTGIKRRTERRAPECGRLCGGSNACRSLCKKNGSAVHGGHACFRTLPEGAKPALLRVPNSVSPSKAQEKFITPYGTADRRRRRHREHVHRGSAPHLMPSGAGDCPGTAPGRCRRPSRHSTRRHPESARAGPVAIPGETGPCHASSTELFLAGPEGS